jgi:hypothetical protein
MNLCDLGNHKPASVLRFAIRALVVAAMMAAHAMTKPSASTKAMPSPSAMTTTATQAMPSPSAMTTTATEATALTFAAPRFGAFDPTSLISPAPAVVAHSVAVPRTPAAPKKRRGHRPIERARHEALLRDALCSLVFLVLREIVLVLQRQFVAIGFGLVSLKKALAIVRVVVPIDHARRGLVLVQFEGWKILQIFRGGVDQNLRKACILELRFRVTNGRFIVGSSRTRPDRAEQESKQPDQRAMGLHFHPHLI